MQTLVKIIVVVSFIINLTNPSNLLGVDLKTRFVTWSELRKLNYRTGEMPGSLRDLIGKSVKIPGFVVPLEGDDGFEFIKEFLLVPVYGMCIHVPPPPPNQVIHVIMDEQVHFEKVLYAVWITGILDIGYYYIEGSKDFGTQVVYDTETSFLIKGQMAEEYDE